MGLADQMLAGILLPSLFCLVGVLTARKGYMHFKTKKDQKRRCLRQTEGTIVAISSMKMNKGRAYFPTYEYAVGEEVIRVKIDLGTTYCQYRRGDRVKIWYDENSPDYSYIEGYKADAVAAVGCLILGCFVTFCGLLTGFLVWFC